MNLFEQLEYVRLSPDSQDFMISLNDETKLEMLKNKLPGLKPDHSTGEWVAASNYDTSRVLRELRLPFTPQATKHCVLSKSTEERLIALSGAKDAELDLPGFGKPPRPFQRAGILYGIERKRLIIGDDMGLGKTIQGLGCLFALDAYPALVVTPPSNKYHWSSNEIPACLPGKVVVLANKKTSLMELMAADVIVTNYQQLVGKKGTRDAEGKVSFTSWEDDTKKHVIHSELSKHLMTLGLKSIICDEAQYIANPAATWTCALMDLRHGVDLRVLLTGTPMLNSASDFYSYLKFLDRIHEFGGYLGFMSRFCGMSKGKFGLESKDSKNTKDLNRMLRATCYVRRMKEEVLTDLPPIQRTSYAIDIDNRAEYVRAEKDLVNWVQERVDRDKKFLDSLANLTPYERDLAIRERKLSKAEAAERGEMIVRINALKTVAAEGKLHAAKEWIDDFIKSGRKLIIFACHIKILDWLQHHYPKSALLRSEMDPAERQRNVGLFQNDPKILTLIGAMGTSAGSSPAGIGHTITAASDILTLEYGWNPAHHDQMEGRAHRIGQLFKVNSNYLLARNTIEDEVIAPLIEYKRAVGFEVVDGIDGPDENGMLDAVRDWASKKGSSALAV